MGQTRTARGLSQESRATVEDARELRLATTGSLRRTQVSQVVRVITVTKLVIMLRIAHKQKRTGNQPRPRGLQRTADMAAVAPESRRCLSSRVSAWRPHLLNLSKKKREEKRLPTSENPIKKIKKGSKKAITLRQQRQSGPKTPAWRC